MAGLITDALAPLAVFRVLFGIACALKFAIDTRRGYAAYFDDGSYLHACYTAHAPRTRLTPTIYRALYAAKLVAAPLVIAGAGVLPALAILALAFAVELRIYFKYHVNFMLLVSVILMFAPGLGEHLTLPGLLARHGDVHLWIRDACRAHGDQAARWAIVATMSVLYVAAAFRKLTPSFLRGAVIYTCLRFVEDERPRRYHGDFWLPRWFLTRFVHGDPARLARRWAPWMWLVFAIELTLPALLLFPPTRPIAVVLGLGMHAAFTLMFPATLLPFSLASASTYVLFADPSSVVALLSHLA